MSKNNRLIIDTGFFVALMNKNDLHHVAAVEFMKQVDKKKKFITTWPVMTEVCHLLLRFSSEYVILFLESYRKAAFEIFQIGESDAVQMIEYMKKYQNLPMDLADASLVLLAEELGHGDIVSTDQRDFKTYKWKRCKPFNNLLF